MMSPAILSTVLVQEDGQEVLQVAGEIDMLTAPTLTAAITACDGSDGVLVLDLAGLTFMDSSGLGVIAATVAKPEQTSRPLRLRNVPAQVQRILQISGLASVVPIADTAA